MDPDQTVCSGSMLLPSILNSSIMLGNFLQQTTSSDDIFRCIFFLALKGLNYQKDLDKLKPKGNEDNGNHLIFIIRIRGHAHLFLFFSYINNCPVQRKLF